MIRDIAECWLYGFVDTAYLDGRSVVRVTQELCDGGVDIVQLRAKEHSAEAIRRMGEAILPITRGAGVPLVINDYLQVALEIGAEFCHLGQEDFFGAGARHARELIPAAESVRLGLSTHAPEQAARAIKAEPDYLAIGPVYATPTKPLAKPVKLEYVRWAAANVSVPWFAIGGINLTNIHDVLGAGATRVCIVSAILNAEDVRATCMKFKQVLLSNSWGPNAGR